MTNPITVRSAPDLTDNDNETRERATTHRQVLLPSASSSSGSLSVPAWRETDSVSAGSSRGENPMPRHCAGPRMHYLSGSCRERGAAAAVPAGADPNNQPTAGAGYGH